ncbi:hypothetical protein HanRHA438_Chr05g0229041 [Helianthus annuus]|nr:hypothetical protein HanRHA438_Chr05g0229041 [Helianthus annuus]
MVFTRFHSFFVSHLRRHYTLTRTHIFSFDLLSQFLLCFQREFLHSCQVSSIVVIYIELD